MWSDEGKRSICLQTTAPGVSVAQVKLRYSGNANLIFNWPRPQVLAHVRNGVRGGRFAPSASGNRQGNGRSGFQRPRAADATRRPQRPISCEEFSVGKKAQPPTGDPLQVSASGYTLPAASPRAKPFQTCQLRRFPALSLATSNARSISPANSASVRPRPLLSAAMAVSVGCRRWVSRNEMNLVETSARSASCSCVKPAARRLLRRVWANAAARASSVRSMRRGIRCRLTSRHEQVF